MNAGDQNLYHPLLQLFRVQWATKVMTLASIRSIQKQGSWLLWPTVQTRQYFWYWLYTLADPQYSLLPLDGIMQPSQVYKGQRSPRPGHDVPWEGPRSELLTMPIIGICYVTGQSRSGRSRGRSCEVNGHLKSCHDSTQLFLLWMRNSQLIRSQLLNSQATPYQRPLWKKNHFFSLLGSELNGAEKSSSRDLLPSNPNVRSEVVLQHEILRHEV